MVGTHVRAQILRPSPNFSRDPVRVSAQLLPPCVEVFWNPNIIIFTNNNIVIPDHHHDQPEENMNMESGGVLESAPPLLSRDEREGVAPGNDFLSF